jgi:hypothetical protein
LNAIGQIATTPITPMSRDVKYGWSKEETAANVWPLVVNGTRLAVKHRTGRIHRRMVIAAQLPEETDLRLSEITSRRLAELSG